MNPPRRPWVISPETGLSTDPERPYVYPGTRVLINRFDIRDAAVLDRVVRSVTALRAQLLDLQPLPGEPDFDYLCAIHRFLFQDVYPWAGALRLVDLDRKDIQENGAPFVASAGLAARAQQVFSALREERYLRGLDADGFIGRCTDYFAQVDMLHPFREGNGRTQRIFFARLAAQAGYRLDVARIDKREMHAAGFAVRVGDLAPLSGLLRAILSAG